MSVLVIAEHDNKELKKTTLNTISAALELDTDVSVLIAGSNVKEIAQECAKTINLSKVIVAESPAYGHFLAENIADLIKELASSYSYILTPATTTGKNFLPRLAALLDVQPISDVLSIESKDTFKRPIYAGNVIATVKSNDSLKLLTIRTTAFDPATTSDESCAIETFDTVIESEKSSFIGEELAKSDRPELTAADAVVSGGRGLQNGENFELLYKLADKLNAAVGASRAAVDAGFVPNDMQVGQTGKIVAPNVYFAVGISGAIQHLAGMKDSKVIVAINKDEDAPIFQVADYGLVADLFEALPELIEKI